MKRLLAILLLCTSSILAQSQGTFLVSADNETYTSFASKEYKVTVDNKIKFRELGFDFILGTDTINRVNFSYDIISNILIGSNGELNEDKSSLIFHGSWKKYPMQSSIPTP